MDGDGVRRSFEAALPGGAVAEWTLREYVLELRQAFGTSHSSTVRRTNALLRLRVRPGPGQAGDGGGFEWAACEGHGEAGLPPKKPGCYEADLDDVAAFFDELAAEPHGGDAAAPGAALPAPPCLASRGAAGDRAMRAVLAAVDRVAARRAADRSTRAALCGAEMAVLDAWTRAAGVSVASALAGAAAGWRPRGSAPPPPRSFYTVALNEELDEMLKAARFGLRHTPLLKVKLDGNVARGRQILGALVELLEREAPEDGLLSVDANAAWTPAAALEYLEVLAPMARRVYMVEQPFPLLRADGRGGVCDWTGGEARPVAAATLDAWREVRERYGERGLSVFGDESVGGRADIEALGDLMHGCNIKLEKAGGLRGALDAMEAASRRGLLVWIGIMVASELNTAAAASLLPLASSGFGDVDGGLLLTERCQLFAAGFSWGARGAVLLADGGRGLNARVK